MVAQSLRTANHDDAVLGWQLNAANGHATTWQERPPDPRNRDLPNRANGQPCPIRPFKGPIGATIGPLKGPILRNVPGESQEIG